MYAGTRIVGDESRTLYPGDIVEGALAAQQVAAGNAEYLAEAKAQPEDEAKADPKDEQKNARR